MSDPVNALSREFIEQQRRRLEALRHQLLGGEEETLAKDRVFEEQHGEEAAEFEDEAQEMQQHEVN